MNINEVSDRLTKQVMFAREKHRLKLKENKDNKILRDLHQNAFTLYGKAETILKMHGDSGITAAKEYIRNAQDVENNLTLFTEYASRDEISDARENSSYHDYFGYIHDNQWNMNNQEKESNKECAQRHRQARDLYKKSTVTESINDMKKAEQAAERAELLTDNHIKRFGKLNLNVKRTERK